MVNSGKTVAWSLSSATLLAMNVSTILLFAGRILDKELPALGTLGDSYPKKGESSEFGCANVQTIPFFFLAAYLES